MNKAQLIGALVNNAKLSRRDADVAVNTIFDIIVDQLRQGEKVQIVGFGTFEVRKRSARTGRNPQDPTKIVKIPEKIVPVFKAGKLLREAVDATVAKKPEAKKAAPKAAKKGKK